MDQLDLTDDIMDEIFGDHISDLRVVEFQAPDHGDVACMMRRMERREVASMAHQRNTIRDTHL